MKLGIVVVYLVAEDDERLLEIHLRQIENNTAVPYRIYAAANRLLPRFRDRLARLPYVTICPIPDVPPGASEHPYYLDRLVDTAVRDGATHICTLHVDSFPVRAGWAEELAAQLQGRCVLAAIQRDKLTDRKPVTECMFFKREFYLAHRPTFRMPEHLLASAEYQRYSLACPHCADSGVGYGFAIWAAQLAWFPLLRVDRGRNRYYCGGLYGDLIFHLGGAVIHGAGPHATSAAQVRAAKLLSRLRSMAVVLLPWRLRRRFLDIFGLSRWVHENFTTPALEANKAALLADPDRFLREIQNQH